LENEAEVVVRAQAGDVDAFERLVVDHQAFVYNLAFRVLGNAQEAEDAAQEALVRAWLSLPKFRSDSRFSTWLYRIVTNVCYNRIPRLRRELTILGEDELLEQPDIHSGLPLENLETDEIRVRLHRQIDELPESYRLLITLRYQQELAYEEIASITGLPLGTVKTGLFRAKRQLRSALDAHEEERV